MQTQTTTNYTNSSSSRRRIAHHEDVLHPRPATALAPMACSVIDDQSEATLDALMQQHLRANNVTSGALAIAKHGELIYGKAFGWHDSNKTTPVREDFISRIASVSKPLTAAAVRQLIARGRISLESAVFQVLNFNPFGGKVDRRLGDIKIKHLLAHRGGWSNDYTFAEGRCAQELGVQHPASRRDVARWIMSKPLQYDPGTQMRYSNVGYLMLGLIVEEVSGMPFLKAIQELVFAPLGVQSDRVIVGDNQPSNSREWNYEGWKYQGSGNNAYARGMWPWDMEGHCAQGGIVTDPARGSSHLHKSILLWVRRTHWHRPTFRWYVEG